MNGLKSLKGTLNGKTSSDNTSLAALSASSLPAIPKWLGSQRIQYQLFHIIRITSKGDRLKVDYMFSYPQALA